jgi:hypothetical protein
MSHTSKPLPCPALHGQYRCGGYLKVLADHDEFAQSAICRQAVLPGATPTRYRAIAGTALDQPPSKSVGTADDLIDAAIAGLD